MPAFTTVVVGLDGSQRSLHALRWTADRVEDISKLHVVHSGAPDPAIPNDIDVGTIHSRDESPSEALIDVAAEVHADAIVVGPHGSGMGHGLGSIAKQLLRDAPIPVVVIDGLEPPRSAEKMAPVVACVGYGDPADTAIAWAADYAQEQSLPLVLLHAVAYRPIFPIDSGSDMLASYLGAGVSMQWARDEVDGLAAELQEARPGLDVSTHVDCTSVIKAVRKAGETAELVVLGKRNQEAFMHVIGTPRLRRLIARSRFPTVVVPATSEPEYDCHLSV